MGRVHDNQRTTSEFSGLPGQFVDRWTKPLARYLRIEAFGGAVLLLAVAVAVILAISPWVNAYQRVWELPLGLQAGPIGFSHSLRDWINHGGMTLSFFLVALELKRELVLGALKDARLAALVRVTRLVVVGLR